MHVDTSAVHAFADALARHAEALDAAAAALVAAHPEASALGTAGAGFTSALASAVRDRRAEVARLSGVVAGAAATARGNATEFVVADSAVGGTIGAV